MIIGARDMKALLMTKFGFAEVPGSKHDAVAFFYEGTKVATTRFSRGSGVEIDDNLLSVIAKYEVRAGTLGFLKGMLQCSNGPEDYLAQLRLQGFLKPPPNK